MIKPYCIAVIGKNYGDEGKGLATDYFSSCDGNVLVVRHNGGAQSGHTVELKESDKRFVFHELSSGSFRYADTLWADSFLPDLYKLREETENFFEISGFVPRIFGEENAKITIIDDILLNMLAETMRGKNRHGSCGMGIWEATLRNDAGFGITLGELKEMSLSDLVKRLDKIRKDYVGKRIKDIESETGPFNKNNEKVPEYIDLLSDENVIRNFASVILDNLTLVEIVKENQLREYLEKYDRIVFESGQGLLLDSENKENGPHVTASRTGIINPVSFLNKVGMELNEAVYVTRSYITRHGAGKLVGECDRETLGIKDPDVTNIENEFQGSIRYAPMCGIEEFMLPVQADLAGVSKRPETVSLMVTHLNEVPLDEEYYAGFDRVYRSYTKNSEDII